MVHVYPILVISFLVGGAVAAVDHKEAREVFLAEGEKCRKEVGASESDLQDILNRKSAANDKAKCMRACIMKHFKVMTTEGKFDKNEALKHVKEITGDDHLKVSDEIFSACENLSVSKDHCAAAEEYAQCVHKEATARGVTTCF